MTTRSGRLQQRQYGRRARRAGQYLDLLRRRPRHGADGEDRAPGSAAPAECPGNATSPQAQAGFLCIYEESRTNTAGVTLNAVNRFGATIFVNSTAAGGFFSYGTWAVTAG